MHDDLFWFVLVRIINVRWCSSFFHITAVHVMIVLTTSQHTLCDTPNYMIVAWSGLMFGDPFHIRYLENISNSLIILERSFMLTFPMAYLAFFIFRPCFGIESQSGYQPLSWSPQFPFWLWRCGFHLVQTVKILLDIQGDNLVTTLYLLVFPNFATTTFFHVHRQKQILLTYEIFLPERLPSGATMINRRWCYNY